MCTSTVVLVKCKYKQVKTKQMANFGIRIDLLKLKGAFLRNIKGKTSTKRCLIIPIDECDGIYVGSKACYLNLVAIGLRDPKFDDTHCVKANLTKEQCEALTDEEYKAIPIIGGMHEIEAKQETITVRETLSEEDILLSANEALPF